MFQKNIDKLCNGMSYVSSIADDILIAGFDELGRDHDATLDKVLRICSWVNMKVNKDKCLFRCTSIPFFSDVISWQGVSPYLRKVQALTDMLPPKSKRELQSLLVVVNYISSHQQLLMSVNCCRN